MKITLTGRIPSKKNSKKLIHHGSRAFLVPSSNHQKWHREKSRELMEYSNVWPAKPIEKAKVDLVFYAPDLMRGDLTNKAESVFDLLVDNGILKDDNWFVCGDIRLIFGGVDRANPRVEILLDSVGSL